MIKKGDLIEYNPMLTFLHEPGIAMEDSIPIYKHGCVLPYRCKIYWMRKNLVLDLEFIKNEVKVLSKVSEDKQ
ncbi:MAG: hypothetical protein Q8P81_03570 [Nanoarchaeota archaeon]|nr:hypothetical protein [Nanoarchaeota archaeon]